MSIKRIFAIIFIVACTAVGWFVLGGALTFRTHSLDGRMRQAVLGNWGPPMHQHHPSVYYIAPTAAQGKRVIQPHSSQIDVKLHYKPLRKGLLWHRTYTADFNAEYVIRNPLPITQTIYVDFRFPAEGARFDEFSLMLGDKETRKAPTGGSISEAVILGAEAEIPLRVRYKCVGTDEWRYSFEDTARVSGFRLDMQTNFEDFDIPAGAESPTDRVETTGGWTFVWDYNKDVIGARAIGMAMPKVLNPGPVAARITFFAPVSLVFFFAVLLIVGAVRGVSLHPMHFFFLAAGCFAFQLLFAYLVDHLPVQIAFAIAAAVSVLLVTVYLRAVAGTRFAALAAVAQFGYMILFSYSFFFDGLTGLTITIGAIVTLALLMAFTAKVDWNAIFDRERREIPERR